MKSVTLTYAQEAQVKKGRCTGTGTIKIESHSKCSNVNDVKYYGVVKCVTKECMRLQKLVMIGKQ